MKNHPAFTLLGKSTRFVLFVFTFHLAGTAFAADSFPRLSDQGDYQGAKIDPKEPELSIEYPGAAINRGLSDGVALVSVAVDKEGHATDFLLVGCSDMIFGRTLLDWARTLKFQPATYRGVAVAGRCQVGYHFQYRIASSCDHRFGFSAWGSTTGGMEVGTAMTLDIFQYFSAKAGRQKPGYTAEAEKNLDAALELTELALPKLPVGYAAPTDHPVKVFVTFYIDEEGKVRLPQVESAAAPELIPAALRAVNMWNFKPATVKGKPTLVYTARAVGFFPRDYVAAVTQ